MPFALLFFGFIIFMFLLTVGLTVWMIYRAAAKRKFYDEQRGAEMRKIAEQSGWKFVAQSEPSLIPSIVSFSPGEDNLGMAEGAPIKIENALLGMLGGKHAAVFDCLYHDLATAMTDVKGSRQTMGFIETENVNFPMFFLVPENGLAKISKAVSRSDIEFSGRPVFNEKYFLSGNPQDESRIRNLFGRNSLLDFYERQSSSFCTMGFQKSIFIYKSRTLIAPAEIKSFLELLGAASSEICANISE